MPDSVSFVISDIVDMRVGIIIMGSYLWPPAASYGHSTTLLCHRLHRTRERDRSSRTAETRLDAGKQHVRKRSALRAHENVRDAAPRWEIRMRTRSTPCAP